MQVLALPLSGAGLADAVPVSQRRAPLNGTARRRLQLAERGMEPRRLLSSGSGYRRQRQGRGAGCSARAAPQTGSYWAKKDPDEKKAKYSNANFPMDSDGRTYHLATRVGEVANRILSVGDLGRAKRLSQFLEPEPTLGELFVKESSRGFVTITGRYKGIPVSIITTLMGTPNMDFMVRESRAVVEGQMAVTRLGTCGILLPDVKVGSILVAAEGSVFVTRNPDAFDMPGAQEGTVSLIEESIDMVATPHYLISRPVPASKSASALLVDKLAAAGLSVFTGLNATACSFYSSQGRVDNAFMDCNGSLLAELRKKYPQACSLEMETFHLLDLARCSKGSIKVAAACIGLACRTTNDFLDLELLPDIERKAGQAVLEALVACSLEDDASTTAPREGVPYVWQTSGYNFEV
mmetsp:Transcript_1527/g.3721  ORF Transcript_1527/g.3721 Transcript_1527/m.3721 type:complete len:408 (-) Transcript_1527:162-1385(-)